MDEGRHVWQSSTCPNQPTSERRSLITQKRSFSKGAELTYMMTEEEARGWPSLFWSTRGFQPKPRFGGDITECLSTNKGAIRRFNAHKNDFMNFIELMKRKYVLRIKFYDRGPWSEHDYWYADCWTGVVNAAMGERAFYHSYTADKPFVSTEKLTPDNNGQNRRCEHAFCFYLWTARTVLVNFRLVLFHVVPSKLSLRWLIFCVFDWFESFTSFHRNNSIWGNETRFYCLWY